MVVFFEVLIRHMEMTFLTWVEWLFLV